MEFDENFIFQAEEKHALIIGYSLGNQRLPEVYDDVKVVEKFAQKQKFTTITTLLDHKATKEAVIGFFTDQAKRCFDHGKKNNNKKYFIMVHYAGHGGMKHGT